MADPQMQQIMAKNGSYPVGRVIMRVLKVGADG